MSPGEKARRLRRQAKPVDRHVQLGGLIKVNTLACQTGGMSPPGSSAAFDSFNEITTVRIELRDTDPVMSYR
jgi:hypothetical protein